VKIAKRNGTAIGAMLGDSLGVELYASLRGKN